MGHGDLIQAYSGSKSDLKASNDNVRAVRFDKAATEVDLPLAEGAGLRGRPRPRGEVEPR